MYIDITEFMRNAEPAEFSASKAELGNDAAQITWRAAKREAAESPLLKTPDDCQALRDWAAGFGAWDDDERAAWGSDDCNALLIQVISGDLRELELLCYSDSDDLSIDWDEAEKLSAAGAISGGISKGYDGRVYFYMGD